MLTLLANVWFLVGLCLWAVGVQANAEAERKLAWPLARGVVAEGHVLEVPAPQGEVGPWFVGVVQYAYSLEQGSPYRSVPVLEGKAESGISLGRRNAEALLDRYPVGNAVDVRYDPEHPSRSVIGDVSADRRFGQWLVGIGLSIASLALSISHFL